MKKLVAVFALTCIVMMGISDFVAIAQDSPLASPLDCTGDCMVGAAVAEWHNLYFPFLENRTEYSVSRQKK
jgi:hypothetical protein